MNTQHAMIAMLAACMLTGLLHAGNTITLRSSVRLPDDIRQVVLADIALLEGEEVQRLADLVIMEIAHNNELRTIPRREIEQKLADAGVNWARVHLNGRDVILRPRPTRVTSGPEAMRPASIDGNAPVDKDEQSVRFVVEAADVIRQNTPLGAITVMMVRGLDRSAAEVRLTFDRAVEQSLTASEETHQYELEPLGNLNADRVEVNVRVWSEARMIRQFSVTVRPEVLSSETTLAHETQRGAVLDPADLQTTRRWMSPGEARFMVSPEEAVGRVLSRRMNAGTVLRSRDVERQTVIQRGDRVIVRCLSGGIVITLHAEARQPGGVGDTIELRKLGERETFTATVTGPAEATLELSRSN